MMPYRWGILRPWGVSLAPAAARGRPCCCASPPTSGSSRSCAAGARRPSRRSTTATTAASSRSAATCSSSADEAEDAVQHTFMAAYRHLVGGAAEIQLRPWLYTIARNRCLSMLRARRERPLDELHEPATEHLSAEAQRRQDVRELLGDVAALPEDQRAALVLAELGAVSHDEIATVLDIPRQKVKALVFQARTSLIASRTARDTPCEEIREQLANLRGGALRRTTLHRHLRECPGCRAFREEVALQRKTLAVALPVLPTLGLKEAALGAAFGSAGAGGGGAAAATGGAIAAKALVAVGAGGRRHDGRASRSCATPRRRRRRLPRPHRRPRRRPGRCAPSACPPSPVAARPAAPAPARAAPRHARQAPQPRQGEARGPGPGQARQGEPRRARAGEEGRRGPSCSTRRPPRRSRRRSRRARRRSRRSRPGRPRRPRRPPSPSRKHVPKGQAKKELAPIAVPTVEPKVKAHGKLR